MMASRYYRLVFISLTGFFTIFTFFKIAKEEQEIMFVSTYKMELCNCYRTVSVNIPKDIKTEYVLYNHTTCGTDAYQRGLGQKVIGFSYYSKHNATVDAFHGYFEGIEQNLETLQTFYPGWVMRLYFDAYEDPSVLSQICYLACQDSNLDLCNIKKLPGTPISDANQVYPMNWRFFPTLDPQVEVFMSRDLDSRLSFREMSSVQEWLNSAKDFHLMRDHEAHTTEILGGMWGVKLNKTDVRNQWAKTWRIGMEDKIVFANRSERGHDQIFLSKYVWPWSKDSTLGHDSYLCQSYPNTKPFPTQRRNESNNFVGAVYKEMINYWKECPLACRPTDHQNWTHC